MDDLLRYIKSFTVECGGRNREEAIRNAFIALDAKRAPGRRSATLSFEAFRVRNLGFTSKTGRHVRWWAVFLRKKKRRKETCRKE